MNSIDYKRLSLLGDKVKANQATKAEKDEFMSMMYESGKITQLQYNDYLNKKNSDEIVNAALAIGAITLIGYLIGKLFDE
ncbi:MAG: hypothetical protein CL840_11545 [Crocinitomicaceae bacterium]|nr:hypothetical protein [Crocinitomicaceae bacterium]|tara:strand:- start:967 stop:1206 length:240 start_codon:yes stop_codon:yes gene_type:complete